MPITTLSGLIKSLIAFPSLKNSGLEITENSECIQFSLIIFSTSSQVPTGTVDLIIICVFGEINSAISLAH